MPLPAGTARLCQAFRFWFGFCCVGYQAVRPPARVYWKGFLRLSLVTINIELFPAVDTKADVRFHQIHKPSGKRVQYEKTVAGVGPVENSDIVKGYEVDDDVYVIVEPEEIEAIRLESKKSIDLVQFVRRDDVDPRYFERPYYMLPADETSVEGYLVIREALQKADKMGLGQITMYGREHLVGISALEGGLILEILRYERELRSAASFFGDLPKMKLDKEMIDLAAQLIERKSARFDAGKFKDRYADALRELVEQKAKGRKLVTAAEPEARRTAKVIDLMQALKRSVAEQKGGEKQPARTSRKSRA